jgi:hypothetical protein
VLQAYRLEHRIRSAAHPFPDLDQEGEWLEAPFWIWTAEDPRRRRVFARHSTEAIVLSDRRGIEVSLPLSADGDAGRAVERLLGLARQGIRIRGRALVTTLWARLALGDLFVHGIGGAKYDQVTDAILVRFFGLQPPEFLVVSATLHLPVPRPAVTVDDLRGIDSLLRELRWHPELHVDHTSVPPLDAREDPERLIKTKRDWIATEPNPENVRHRFLEIRRVNGALQPWVAHQRKHLLAERAETTAALRAHAILSSREYSFCLYPEQTLREFLDELLP